MNKLLIFILFIGLNISLAILPKEILLVTGEWAPFTSSTTEGQGFVTEIISATFKEMGVKPIYEFYPWKRCEAFLISGKAWGAFPYSPTKQRQKTFNFSTPITYSKSKFFYSKYNNNIKNDFQWNQLSDLKNFKVGGVRGYFYVEQFEKENIDITFAENELSAIRMLDQNMIDYFPINELVFWNLVKTHFPTKITQFDSLDKALIQNNLNVMISRKYPQNEEITKAFNKALKKVKKKKVYQAILKKYNLL